MLNDMNESMNDLTLLPIDQRPPVVPIETWIPRVMIELPCEIANTITARPEFSYTRFLKDRRGCEIGPTGHYHVRAQYTGTISEVAPCRRQRHLLRVQIGDQFQLIPASALLSDDIDIGSTVRIGQPIADVCRRMQLANWIEVCDLMDSDADGNPVDFGNADWWLLPDILDQQMIRPGEHGWQGPGTLLDLRLLPEASLDRSWRWYFDLEPCMRFLNPDGGYIACPPFYHPNWRDTTLVANGIAYVLRAATNCRHNTDSRH